MPDPIMLLFSHLLERISHLDPYKQIALLNPKGRHS
jgi:hypothetical protein